MKTGHLVAAFEMSYTTSFKHSARVKYNVDFTGSNVDNIIAKLSELKENIHSGKHNDIHVGYDITIEDVIHVQSLLTEIVNRYKELITTTPPPKLYTLINQLREAIQPTPREIAKDVLKEILTPQQPAKLTRKERIKQEAKALSLQRAIVTIKKNSAKKNDDKE